MQTHNLLILSQQSQRSQLWVVETEKLSVTFSHAWLILVEFPSFY